MTSLKGYPSKAVRRGLAPCVAGALIGAAAFAATGCKQDNGDHSSAAAGDPAFDEKWRSLAREGAAAFYIEDDHGEGLMGNVRRATDVREDPAVQEHEAVADEALPEHPEGRDIQRTIRSHLSAVKGCYMTMAKSGDPKSGKAIVSFGIDPEGHPSDVQVDAPTFDGTTLPRCVSGQVARWSFPKSQKGGGQVSFPFVFVGG